MSEIHSCSYYCTRPTCVLQQRDELRDEMLAALEWKKAQQAEPVAIPGAIPMSEVAARSRAMPERADALERARKRLDRAEPVVKRINAGPVGHRYKYPDGDWRFSGGIKINGCDPIDSEPVYTHPAPKAKQAEQAAVQAAVLAEREACARLCESTLAWMKHLYNEGCMDCAKAIRGQSVDAESDDDSGNPSF